MSERFQPGRAHGGAPAVVDTQRGSRAVCIILPDPEKPTAAQRLQEIFCRTLNGLDEQARRKQP
ncbi:MAG: hypothetical protein ACOZEN_13965 [Thermodesulfobacteriota bacterium]|jgi:hypothetical protein